MKKRKTLLEEVEKTWSVAKSINEAAATPVANTAQPVQPAQAQKAPQQPAQPQAAAQPNAQVIQTNMDQGMSELVKNLPAILKSFTATAGDKDNQLDVAGQPQANVQQPQQGQQAPQAQGQRAPQQAPAQQAPAQQAPAQQGPAQQGQQVPHTQGKTTIKETKQRELYFDEAKFNSHFKDLKEGGLIGLAISAPAILQFGGGLLQKLGSKTNPNMIQKFGGLVSKAGESLHHKYLGVIEKVISPFMPNADAHTKHKAAQALFMVLVSGMFASTLASPDALNAVKGKELANYVKTIAPKILTSVGFA